MNSPLFTEDKKSVDILYMTTTVRNGRSSTLAQHLRRLTFRTPVAKTSATCCKIYKIFFHSIICFILFLKQKSIICLNIVYRVII